MCLSQEQHADIQSQLLPEMLCSMLQALRSHMTTLDLSDLRQGLCACFKVLCKIQMPVAYMDMEVESSTQDAELQILEESDKHSQVT